MSIFITDIRELVSKDFLNTIAKIVEAKDTDKEEKDEGDVKTKPTEKTEVETDPKINGVDGDGNEEKDDDNLQDKEKKEKSVKPKKKSSVRENIDVTFSDSEIAHFDKIINNTEGNQ